MSEDGWKDCGDFKYEEIVWILPASGVVASLTGCYISSSKLRTELAIALCLRLLRCVDWVDERQPMEK